MRIATVVLTHLPPSGMPAASLASIVSGTALERLQVIGAVDRLAKRGLATKAGIGRYRRTAAGDLVAAAGATIKPGPKRPGVDAKGAPQQRDLRADHAAERGTLRDRVWRALRMLKKATIPELLELAAREGEECELSNVHRYLSILADHDLVTRLKRRLPGASPMSRGLIQWALIRDVGPKAPLYRKATSELINRNSGAVINRGKK